MAEPALKTNVVMFGRMGRYRLTLAASEDGRPLPNARIEVVGSDGNIQEVRADEHGTAAVVWVVADGENVWLSFTVNGHPVKKSENLWGASKRGTR